MREHLGFHPKEDDAGYTCSAQFSRPGKHFRCSCCGHEYELAAFDAT
jgi:hypothetical protein